VEDLRAGAPSRHCTVLFGAATEADRFVESLAGDPARLVEQNGPRVLFDVARNSDPTRLMATANEAGEVRSFLFEPPGLEELFLDLVEASGRETAVEELA
ncbi:MAG: DUF4162 domain-containing protein, partial [Acidimicrobiales bacterium]|nr:DUF4162 domain-containing protein [Acidimicrobiales bacterium]